MSIVQPTQTTIHPRDFRERTYDFPVESILIGTQSAGLLMISASAGYMVSTSLNQEPKREQVLEHRLQPDGQWVATGTVTIWATGDEWIDGSISIQNAASEMLLLTIQATTTALVRRQATMLSHPALTFAATDSGKPSFLLVTLNPSASGGPIQLTTDNAAHFQLASDSRPAFSSQLTLPVTSAATAIHVRYSAAGAGVHTGNLIISQGNESQTVPMTGRSVSRLRGLKSARVRRAYRPRPASFPRFAGLALALAAVLGWAAYQYPFSTKADTVTEEPTQQIVSEKPAQPSLAESLPAQSSQIAAIRRPVKKTQLSQSGEPSDQETRLKQEVNTSTNRSKTREKVSRRSRPVDARPDPVEEESELEKALNQ